MQCLLDDQDTKWARPRNARSLFASRLSSPISHSQTTRHRHPLLVRRLTTSLSLVRFAFIFGTQYSRRLCGARLRPHPLWPCQKQPCMNTTEWRFRNAMSGRPGRSEAWSRYRYPSLYRRRRTAISGRVFFARTADITALRCSGVTRSKADSEKRDSTAASF